MARVTYNKLLTNLASASRNISPRSFLYGPRSARSELPRPRANISQYGPRARLVRGYYCLLVVVAKRQHKEYHLFSLDGC